MGVEIAIFGFILALMEVGKVVILLTGAEFIGFFVSIPRAIAPILGLWINFSIGVTCIGMHRLRIRRGRFGLIGHRVHHAGIFFEFGGIGWEWEQAHAQRIGANLSHDKIFFVFSLIIFFEKRLDSGLADLPNSLQFTCN
jgi:hypothetical protein